MTDKTSIDTEMLTQAARLLCDARSSVAELVRLAGDQTELGVWWSAQDDGVYHRFISSLPVLIQSQLD